MPFSRGSVNMSVQIATISYNETLRSGFCVGYGARSIRHDSFDVTDESLDDVKAEVLRRWPNCTGDWKDTNSGMISALLGGG